MAGMHDGALASSMHHAAQYYSTAARLGLTHSVPVGPPGLIRMLSSRPPLSRVVLSVCSGLGPDLPVALAQLAQLADLDLSYTAVGRVRPLLAGCSGLTRLCLGSCRELQATELLDLLPSNVSIVSFVLYVKHWMLPSSCC